MAVTEANPDGDQTRLSASQPVPKPRPRADFFTVLGEVLITAGTLTGLFVVWQLFYTDVQSGRLQEQVIASLDWVEPIVALPVVDGPPEIPIIDDADKFFTYEGAPEIPTPATAETFATLYVPRWGDDYIKPISEGTSRRDVLDPLGIGHYPDTVMPGHLGNFAIAGHRTTYGKPFEHVDLLEPGDALVVETADAWFVYQVVSHEIVRPRDVHVISPNPFNIGATPDRAAITLTSCHPKFSAAQRFIVYGELSYWAFKGDGFPSEIVPQEA